MRITQNPPYSRQKSEWIMHTDVSRLQKQRKDPRRWNSEKLGYEQHQIPNKRSMSFVDPESRYGRVSSDYRGIPLPNPSHPPPMRQTSSPISSSEKSKSGSEMSTKLQHWDYVLMFLIFLFLALSFTSMGLTLVQILSPIITGVPKLLIFVISILCFTIVTYPILVLSGNRGCTLFFGILGGILLGTCALTMTLAMTPMASCFSSGYREDHPLTGGMEMRCVLVQSEIGLLWGGNSDFKVC